VSKIKGEKIVNDFQTNEDSEAGDVFDAFTPRNREEIKEAINKLDDQIRYHLHRTRPKGNDGRSEICDSKIQTLRLKCLEIWMEQTRTRYDVESGELGPFTDLEVAEMNGRLSALRWVLGVTAAAPKPYEGE
jgi:hypothetical protein